MQARDLMTADVVTVSPETPVPEIARLLYERHISGVPVVDQAGRLVGMVSEHDLLLRPEIGFDRPTRWWLTLFGGGGQRARDYLKTHGRIAGQVMTREVASVEEDTPLGEVARLMAERQLKRMPVMRAGRLVGIITRGDLMRALATEAKARAAPAALDDRTIREAVVEAIDALGAGAHINVMVSDGVVHLWGVVDTPEERQAVQLAAEEVQGVKAVENYIGKRPVYGA